MLLAYEFLAGYRAGLTYTGLDDGYPQWLGTPQQHTDAEYLTHFFEDNGFFPEEPEYYSSNNN